MDHEDSDAKAAQGRRREWLGPGCSLRGFGTAQSRNWTRLVHRWTRGVQ